MLCSAEKRDNNPNEGAQETERVRTFGRGYGLLGSRSGMAGVLTVSYRRFRRRRRHVGYNVGIQSRWRQQFGGRFCEQGETQINQVLLHRFRGRHLPFRYAMSRARQAISSLPRSAIELRRRTRTAPCRIPELAPRPRWYSPVGFLFDRGMKLTLRRRPTQGPWRLDSLKNEKSTSRRK
jgi:hypothetical protein